MKTLKFLLPDGNGFNTEDGIKPVPSHYEMSYVDALTEAGYLLEFAWKANSYDPCIETSSLGIISLVSLGFKNILWNIKEGRISNVKMFSHAYGDCYKYDGIGIFCPIQSAPNENFGYTEYSIENGNKTLVQGQYVS